MGSKRDREKGGTIYWVYHLSLHSRAKYRKPNDLRPNMGFRMGFNRFDLVRGQSAWEDFVDINLSGSGNAALSLNDLSKLGFNLNSIKDVPLGYVPTNGTHPLREAVSNLYPGASEESVLVTNGTSEANFLVTQTLLEQGGEVLFQIPNHLQISGLAKNMQRTIRHFPMDPQNGWEPDWDVFEEKLNHDTRLIYVSTPNNPTGYVLNEADIDRIVHAAESVGAYILSDEIFHGTEWNEEPSPTFWGRSDRVIVTSGLSKAYGLPGLRIGWIVGPPEIVAHCWAYNDFTSTSPGTLSDSIARFALRPENQIKLFEKGREFVKKNRITLNKWIAQFGGQFSYHIPQAGPFALIHIDNAISTVKFSEILRVHHSVLLVPGAWLGVDSYVRIGMGVNPEEFLRGLELITPEFHAIRKRDLLAAP